MQSAVARSIFYGAHYTARPAFYGAVPVAWIGGAVAANKPAAAAAYRLTLAQALTFGITVGVKYGISRRRPYVDRPLVARASRHQGEVGRDARLSFPSGHASISAVLATSWSLSYPRWYVIAPSAAWASAVALSRVHLGVHYPSDILAGAALGVGMAVLVHQLRNVVTPALLRDGSAQPIAPAMPITVRFRF